MMLKFDSKGRCIRTGLPPTRRTLPIDALICVEVGNGDDEKEVQRETQRWLTRLLQGASRNLQSVCDKGWNTYAGAQPV
jgi:hypothetical protein